MVKPNAAERVEAVIGRMIKGAGLKNQSELARELGVRRAAVTDAKRRGGAPAQWILTLCRKRGLSPLWIETGRGPRLLGRGPDPVFESGSGDADRHREVVMVPLVRARVSGGPGSLETGDDAEDYLPFLYGELKRRGRVSAMRLMRVTGDSMAPTLMDGDVVLVDTEAVEPVSGRIYAVRIDDEIVVKRMDRKPGRLVLLSDNSPLYPPVEVEPGRGVDVAVIGKVAWVGRELG